MVTSPMEQVQEIVNMFNLTIAWWYPIRIGGEAKKKNEATFISLFLLTIIPAF